MQTPVLLEMFNKTKIVGLFVDVNQKIYPFAMEGLISIFRGLGDEKKGDP